MKLSFIGKLAQKKETLVIVSDKKSISKIVGLNKSILNIISKSIKNENFKFNKFESIEIIGEEKTGYSKVIIIGCGEVNSLNLKDYDLIGGKITQLNSKFSNNIEVLVSQNISNDELIMRIGYGAILATYRFDKYK